MFKRTVSILLTAAVCLFCTACHGLPPTTAELKNEDDSEAELILQENRQAFLDKVGEVYESTSDEVIADFFSKYHMTNAMIVKNQYSEFDQTQYGLDVIKIKSDAAKADADS